MEYLGTIHERQVYYCNLRNDPNWFTKLPGEPWIAFTIVNEEDRKFLTELTKKCLDLPVCYTCSAGELASLTEDYFDEEIVWREVQKEMNTGEQQNYDATPMTSFHTNFSEGFWFACVSARQTFNEEYIDADKVVCLDCTEKRVRNHLTHLLEEINSGWLPSDEEIELPEYDY